MSPRTSKWEELEQELLGDAEVQKALRELEPAYQIARLRIMRGLTQRQLADMVGTKQPAIARLESGEQPPSLSFLQRVVDALGGKLTINIEPKENAQACGRGA